MAAAAEAAGRGFGDRVYRLLEQVDYRRADTAEELEAIYRLRYDAYLREGTIAANIAKRVTDSSDEMPNAYTIGVHIDGRLASSFRLHVSTPKFSDIPAAHVFPDILSPLIEAQKVIIDPTRFVADAAAARQYPELPYATVRIAAMATEYFEADYVLATVRAEHQAFYRRVFGCKPVCPPRPYPGLIKPISLMMVEHRVERETIARRYPFFRSTFFERRMLFERAVAAKVAQRTAA
jgi:hypothetical protein